MTQLDSTRPPAVKRLPKDYVPGYAAVLLRAEVKMRLRQFRAEAGLLMESQVERCLVTAAFELLLNDRSLHQRWINCFKEAVTSDYLLTIKDVHVNSEGSHDSA